MSKGLLTAILAILLIGAMIMQTGCQQNANANDVVGSPAEPAVKQNPQVTFEMTDGTKYTIELYPEYAPNTVNNFVSLAKQGVYNGTLFHRILPNLNRTGVATEGIIQGGAYVMEDAATGTVSVRETGYAIKAEVINNGFARNTLKHTPGVISMARTSEYDSASNQFFIVTCDYPSWDGEYCAFGKVIEGLENVEAIINYYAVSGDNYYTSPSTIKNTTVETFGVEWPEPEKMAG